MTMTRNEKIKFLQKLEQGLVSIKDLRPNNAVIIYDGKKYKFGRKTLGKTDVEKETKDIQAVLYLPCNKRN